MVTTKLNLSMTEPSVRQIYAKQGDTGRVLDITLDQTPEDGTLRILRPDGVEVTSEANLASDTYNVQTTPYYSGETTDLGMVMGTIEGKSEQDLNGFDKPWVGGAGKNLFNATVDGYKAENTNGTWSGNTYTINGVSFALNTDDGGNVISITVNGTSSNSNARIYCPNTSLPANTTFTLHGVPRGYGGTNLALYLGEAMAAIGVNPSTGNGSPTTFTTVTAGNVRPAINVNPNVTITNAVCYPQLELGTTATSYEPYSNICPITSFATTEFVSEGKNLLNVPQSVTLDGVGYLAAINTPIHLPVGTYTLSFKCSSVGSTKRYQIILQSGTTRVFSRTDDISDSTTLTFTTTHSADNVTLFCNNSNGATYTDTMIELGSTATSYVPYQSPSTASAPLTLRSLPDGTCDTYEDGVVTRRVGVHYITSSDSGSLQKGTYGNRVAITMPDMEAVSRSKRTNTICNIATPDTGALDSTAWVVGQCLLYDSFAGNPAFFVIVDSAYASLSPALSYLESIGAYFYYPLATPTTETVTIPTLVTYENYTYVHNDSETDPTSIEYKAIMLESGQVAIPSEATEVVGKCYCDVEQNGVSSMPFTLNVKKNERES